MPGRNFDDMTAADFKQLQSILENYAIRCGETAEFLENRTFRTDGFVTVKKGIFALRNLLAKQLGQKALSDFPIVATWVFRKPKKAKPVRLNTAAESPAIYDLTQGNPSMKQQAKAIKAIDKEATQAAKKKAKPSKPDNA
jgi:hypothetical protein